MDFEKAIRAHTFWKVTLRWLVNGRKGLDVERLGDERACELGEWIRGTPEALRDQPAFADLVREHTEFHRQAGEVARLAAGGETAAAEALLAPEGAFTRASARTIDALRRLEAQVGERGNG